MYYPSNKLRIQQAYDLTLMVVRLLHMLMNKYKQGIEETKTDHLHFVLTQTKYEYSSLMNSKIGFNKPNQKLQKIK